MTDMTFLGYHTLKSTAEEDIAQYPVGRNVSCFMRRDNVKYNDVDRSDLSVSSYGLLAFTLEEKDSFVQRYFIEISQKE